MHISTIPKHQKLRTKGDNFCSNIRGKDLDVVQKVKYPEVHLDNSLDWKEQIKVISSKESNAFGLLKHAKNFPPDLSLRSLYFNIVEPHFCYWFYVWGCSASNTLLELQKLQNRVSRILTNSAFDAPSSPILRNLGWMNLLSQSS